MAMDNMGCEKMTTPYNQAVAAIFVRHPVPGRVKTRLAHDLGNEAACDLYRAMVADTLANVRACGLPLFLFHDGKDVDGLPPEWTNAADRIYSQEGKSLGERMNAAFERSFSAGALGVILVGSDIPGIDGDLLRSAMEAIELHDAVIAPAFDGGYCLIASKRDRFNSAIFREIAWSTDRVLDMTIAACTSNGVSHNLLAPRQDIDTMEDLAAYCRRPCGSAPATNAWLVARGMLTGL